MSSIPNSQHSLDSEKSLKPDQLLEPRATKIAAWLIWNDARALLLLYPLLILVPILRHFISDSGPILAALIVLDRCAELTFLYFISRRALTTLGFKLSATKLSGVLIFCAWGFGLWLIFQAGVFLQLIADSPRSILVSGACTGIGTIFGLRYFYYFLPAVTGRFNFREVGAIALHFVRSRPLLGLRSLFPALAWVVFLTGLISIFSPDGRLFGVNLAIDLISGLFFLISTYLSIGIAYSYCDEFCWHEIGVNLTEIFPAVEKRRRGNEKLLSRGTAIRISLAACLLWIGNTIIDLTTPPAATIEIISATAKDYSAELQLKLNDSIYSLRGLDLNAFSLAGEKRIPVSTSIVSLTDQANNKIEWPLHSDQTQSVNIVFTTDRRAEDLASLQDLYLWYKMVRLAHISIKR